MFVEVAHVQDQAKLVILLGYNSQWAGDMDVFLIHLNCTAGIFEFQYGLFHKICMLDCAAVIIDFRKVVCGLSGSDQVFGSGNIERNTSGWVSMRIE